MSSGGHARGPRGGSWFSQPLSLQSKTSAAQSAQRWAAGRGLSQHSTPGLPMPEFEPLVCPPHGLLPVQLASWHTPPPAVRQCHRRDGEMARDGALCPRLLPCLLVSPLPHLRVCPPPLLSRSSKGQHSRRGRRGRQRAEQQGRGRQAGRKCGVRWRTLVGSRQLTPHWKSCVSLQPPARGTGAGIGCNRRDRADITSARHRRVPHTHTHTRVPSRARHTTEGRTGDARSPLPSNPPVPPTVTGLHSSSAAAAASKLSREPGLSE